MALDKIQSSLTWACRHILYTHWCFHQGIVHLWDYLNLIHLGKIQFSRSFSGFCNVFKLFLSKTLLLFLLPVCLQIACLCSSFYKSKRYALLWRMSFLQHDIFCFTQHRFRILALTELIRLKSKTFLFFSNMGSLCSVTPKIWSPTSSLYLLEEWMFLIMQQKDQSGITHTLNRAENVLQY